MHKLVLKRICHGLSWRFLHAKHTVLSYVRTITAAIRTNVRFMRLHDPLPHNLPGELIISLTSYPPRFATLLPTLKCLLAQSMRTDRIILWISKEALINLPVSVTKLQDKGLEIRISEDTGPYTKIIPTLRNFPSAFIVTADDDLYYPPHWLQKLVEGWDGTNNQIVCHRAHGIKFNTDGLPIPYRNWEFDIKGPVRSVNIFPTGVGGVFYPPGCLSYEVTDEEKFMMLSPKADDIWLYWMGRRAGAIYQKTSGRIPHIMWLKSQKIALAHDNLGEDANDKKIAAMIEHYGWPA